MLQQLVSKPFEKDEELVQLKKDVSKLEREISIKIQENQMKQHSVADGQINTGKESPVVKLEKALLQKNKIGERKSKGIRC